MGLGPRGALGGGGADPRVARRAGLPPGLEEDPDRATGRLDWLHTKQRTVMLHCFRRLQLHIHFLHVMDHNPLLVLVGNLQMGLQHLLQWVA